MKKMDSMRIDRLVWPGGQEITLFGPSYDTSFTSIVGNTRLKSPSVIFTAAPLSADNHLMCVDECGTLSEYTLYRTFDGSKLAEQDFGINPHGGVRLVKVSDKAISTDKRTRYSLKLFNSRQDNNCIHDFEGCVLRRRGAGFGATGWINRRAISSCFHKEEERASRAEEILHRRRQVYRGCS